MKEQLQSPYKYVIGVDGGGTGTRVLVADQSGRELARGCAGPSGLMHGSKAAWASILAAIDAAFLETGINGSNAPDLSQCVIACGLAGVHNKVWAQEFCDANPGFAGLVLETDAFTTLLGAHQGHPGAIIALGTGSVGEVMQADGSRREVGGWGFPSSDEASGAWMGLRAINHLQHVLDGRAQSNEFSLALLAHCGGHKDAVFNWLAGANQTRFAQLAPIVIEYAARCPQARDILLAAGKEVEKMANALDPSATMPIALCGGLAEALWSYLPQAVLPRMTRPQGDSVQGALILVMQHFEKKYATD